MTRLLAALCSLSASCTLLFSPDEAGSNDAGGNPDSSLADGAVTTDGAGPDAGIAPYSCTEQGTEAVYHFDGNLADDCAMHPLTGPFVFGNGHVTGNAYGEVAVSVDAFPTTSQLSFDFWYRSKSGGEGVLVALQGADAALASRVVEIRQTDSALEMAVYGIGCNSVLATLQVPVAPPDEFVHVSATLASGGMFRLSVLGVGEADTDSILSCTNPEEATFLFVGGLAGDSDHAHIDELRVSRVARPPHQFP